MKLLRLAAVCIGLGTSAFSAEPKYDKNVVHWQEAAVPGRKDSLERLLWSYASNYSPHEWKVSLREGKVYAELRWDSPLGKQPIPKFMPVAENLRLATSFKKVDDGWLVGFNEGEFGAALYWFSPDGNAKYKVSNDQVVDFFTVRGEIYVIQGFVNIRGSVIQLIRPNPGAHWKAILKSDLLVAPYAVSVRRNGKMLITLSSSLLSVDGGWKITTLLKDPPWASVGLYPNSSALAANEDKLYIGMRQYVGEFELSTRKLRLLIPSSEFLDKLPKEQEEDLRNQWKKCHAGSDSQRDVQ